MRRSGFADEEKNFLIIMAALINLILAVLYFNWIILAAPIQYFLCLF